MVDHVTLTLQGDNPDNILYAGTNDLRSEKTPSQISKSTELVMVQQFDENNIWYCPAIW